MNTSPPIIRFLKPDQVFVFGSNIAGIHGAGAARDARRWGALMGIGEGLRGQTYALPTCSIPGRSLTINEIRGYANRFLVTVSAMPHRIFLLTEVGCGIAGHKVEDIAPLFAAGVHLPNLHFPERFITYLENTPEE